MAIGQAYASVEEYLAVTGNSNPADRVVIAEQLIAASRVFDRETQQYFGRDAAVVERIFRARYTDRLDLDYEGQCPGIADTTGLLIQVDETGAGGYGTAWAATDYELHPLGAEFGPEPRPWDTIRTAQGGSESFVPGNNVKVTAIFGWPAVPQAVKADVIKLCAIWRNEASRTASDEAFGGVMENSLLRRWRDAYSTRRVTL